MPTPDELRAAIATGREDFQAALRDVAGRWDAPVPATDGEEQWTARRTAEHAIGAEAYFATQVCLACGYPGLEPVKPSYTSATEAILAFQKVSAKSDGRLKYVTENDLGMKHERWGDVASIMTINAKHLHEHAAQLRTAGT